VSRTNASVAETEVASVAFVPLLEDRLPPCRPGTKLAMLPLVDVLLRELGQPLANLARRVRRAGPFDGAAVVLLAGCGRGAGCSTLAVALAAAAARERAVLLVDADLGRTGLSALLGASGRTGWEEAVRGLCAFEEPVQHPDEAGVLAFLPLRQPVADPEGLIRQPVLPSWLARLRREYSLIVLDGGTVQDTATRWAPLTDGALLVCDARRTSASDWAAAWDQLEQAGSSVLGIVETFVEGSRQAI
jgi:Mrp family chromosome partitioning ATPase